MTNYNVRSRDPKQTKLRVLAEIELRRRNRLTTLEDERFDPLNPPAGMGFREWCQALGDMGLKVDGHAFDLSRRPALHAIYDLIPATAEEAQGRIIALQKGAQMGLTVWEVLADLFMAIKWRPITIGMYLPDAKLASYKSEHRFMRLVRTIPSIYRALTSPPDGALRNSSGEGNKLTRTLLDSIFLFLWTSGQALTESFPADVLSFDEVQGMAPDDISRTMERLSASSVRFTMMLSTPKWPDADINFWYRQGTQHRFHTECSSCGEFFVLSDHFPDVIVSDQFCCPSCRTELSDPQMGEWIPTYPDREIESYHLPQLLSPTVTPKQLLWSWQTAKTGDQRRNFMNRKLGMPYADPDQIPVNLEHLAACAEAGKREGAQWEPSGAVTYMGIDQMGGFNAVLIARALPGGRSTLVHAAAIFTSDPFADCDVLMKRYGVTCCVVEGLPNWNDAKRFANRHPGRVFVASYGDQADTIVWGDMVTKADKKTKEEERDRYVVRLSQYKAMQMALARITDGLVAFPDPTALECDYKDGAAKRVALLRDVVFEHLTKVALISERDPETGRWRSYVKKVGIDPHYAYAWMLLEVALARNSGGGQIMLGDTSGTNWMPGGEPTADGMETSLLGGRAMEVSGDVCGKCDAYKAGWCGERGLAVGERDPACVMFVAEEG